MPKHTPGPWQVVEIEPGKYEVRDTEHGHGYGLAGVTRTGPRKAWFNKANARLIAAAPDLLEALQQMQGAFDTPIARRRISGEYAEIAREMACAAIAKATGDSP